MLADKLVGPKVRIILTKFLPGIFMDAMRDSAEASVHMFEGLCRVSALCCWCVQACQSSTIQPNYAFGGRGLPSTFLKMIFRCFFFKPLEKKITGLQHHHRLESLIWRALVNSRWRLGLPVCVSPVSSQCLKVLYLSSALEIWCSQLCRGLFCKGKASHDLQKVQGCKSSALSENPLLYFKFHVFRKINLPPTRMVYLCNDI